MPVILPLGMEKQKDQYEFQANLGNVVRCYKKTV